MLHSTKLFHQSSQKNTLIHFSPFLPHGASIALLLNPLFLIVLFLLQLVQKSKPNNSTSNLPPGPWKLPLIGNLHQIASSLPHHALRDLAKKHGPLMSLQLGEVLTVVVSSPEMAKEVMKTHDIIIASRPHIIATRIVSYDSTNLTFAPYGPYWKQLRKICTTELLSRQRVLSFQIIRHEEASKSLDPSLWMQDQPSTLHRNLTHSHSKLLPGLPLERDSKIKKHSYQL